MSELAPLSALVAALPQHRRVLIERELLLLQREEETPAERRLRTLLPLAEMLEERSPLPDWSFPLVRQADYDRERPATAPTSDWLAERFDGWLFACRAAYGIKADASWEGRHNPWPNPTRNPGVANSEVPRGTGREPYTRKEILRAIRRCARELGLHPTSTTFDRWVIRKRAAGRARGITVRLPRAQQIYRHFPADEGGYNAALTAAGIGDGEIVEAQAERLGHERVEAIPMAADEIAALTDEQLVEAGVAGADIGRLRADGAGSLPFSQAAALARHLGGSLNWLSGQSLHRGESPAQLAFDATGFEQRRRALGIPEAEGRGVLGLDRGAYRRFVNGRFEPSLDAFLQLAPLVQG